jgi:hypothetical protein
MIVVRALLVLLGGCASCTLLVRGFRPATLLLLGAGLAGAGLAPVAALQARRLPIDAFATILVAIELTTAVSAALIFFATGSALQRGSAVSRGAAGRAGFPRYALPLLAVALLLVLTLIAPRCYPYAPREIDYAWTLLLLSGVLSIVLADTLLRIGLGLTLLSFGLKLFYLAVAARVGLTEVALLNIVTLALALIVAYLSALLYDQRNTLKLEAMDEEAVNDQPSAVSYQEENEAVPAMLHLRHNGSNKLMADR